MTPEAREKRKREQLEVLAAASDHAQWYRLPLQQREKLQFKILLAVPDSTEA